MGIVDGNYQVEIEKHLLDLTRISGLQVQFLPGTYSCLGVINVFQFLFDNLHLEDHSTVINPV
jgi:hypothetical protein